MSTVSVNGSSVHYSVTGAGPGLVFVHGASLDGASNFGHLVDKFTDERTVVLPDYAGSGETPLPVGELSLELLADQVVAAVSEAATGPVDVVGISLGAVVAAAIAAKYPDLVRRVVLVAGWSHLDDPRLRLGLETWGAVMDNPELHSAQGPLMAFSPAFLSGLGADGLATLRAAEAAPGTRQQLDLILQADIRDQLPLIQAPTLVVGCALDYLIPVQHARALHESIPGSHYVELESGHVVTAEKPTEIVALLRDFLLHDEPAQTVPGTNAALLESYYDRIHAGDLVGAAALLHEDFTFLVSTESDELTKAIPWAGRILRGRAGFEELVTTLFGEFESVEFQAREFHPVEDKVFVQGTFAFRHNVTGRHATSDWIARFQVVDGLIHNGQFFENTYAVAAARM